MLTVGCMLEDCIHNKEGFCNFEGHINIGEQYYYFCDEYSSYLNTPKYKERYFIARSATDELPKHRIEQYGRKIEYKGFTFFTQSHNYQDDIMQYVLTESKTGYHCGTLTELQKPERWKVFVESVKNTPDVMELPLAEMHEGKYIITVRDSE